MGAFDAIVEIDHQLFFYLNGLHKPWMDGVMETFSNKLFWIPLYAWVYYLIYKKYNKGAFVILLCAIGLIFFSDQTANVFKVLVQRYRPTHNPSFGHLVHTVNDYKGGLVLNICMVIGLLILMMVMIWMLDVLCWRMVRLLG